MDLSIIIVNWKSVRYLRDCLASLYRQVRELEFEVIVVENASGDGCEAMLAREYPQVRMVVATENLGFARANNLGFRQSHGDTLLFLNPDTEVKSGAVQRMASWLRVHRAVGAVGARLLNSDGTCQESCVQAFPTLLNQFLDANLIRRLMPGSRMWGASALLNPDGGPVKVDTISGACFMVKREVFEKVDGFTADYFMYSDDVDLSYKIWRAGYAVVCLPECEVVHHGGRSSSQRLDSFAAVQRRAALSQFFRRTRGPVYAGLYRVAMSVAALLRMALAVSAMPFAGKPATRRMLWAIVTRWRHIFVWSVGLRGRFCFAQNG